MKTLKEFLNESKPKTPKQQIKILKQEIKNYWGFLEDNKQMRARGEEESIIMSDEWLKSNIQYLESKIGELQFA